MKFTAFVLWTLTAPFFVGGVAWAIAAAAAAIPLWAVAVGMFAHLAIWGSVQETMMENGWDD